MSRNPILYIVLLTAMFLGSGCTPPTPTATPVPTSTAAPITATPVPTSTAAPMQQAAPLEPYTKVDKCPTQTLQEGGKITYQSSMAGGFSGTLQMSGLNP